MLHDVGDGAKFDGVGGGAEQRRDDLVGASVRTPRPGELDTGHPRWITRRLEKALLGEEDRPRWLMRASHLEGAMRRHLPIGNGIAEPLFRGDPPRPIRRLWLVCRNNRSDPAGRRPSGGRCRHLSVRLIISAEFYWRTLQRQKGLSASFLAKAVTQRLPKPLAASWASVALGGV